MPAGSSGRSLRKHAGEPRLPRRRVSGGEREALTGARLRCMSGVQRGPDGVAQASARPDAPALQVLYGPVPGRFGHIRESFTFGSHTQSPPGAARCRPRGDAAGGDGAGALHLHVLCRARHRRQVPGHRRLCGNLRGLVPVPEPHGDIAGRLPGVAPGRHVPDEERAAADPARAALAGDDAVQLPGAARIAAGADDQHLFFPCRCL
jgi:hypothetical protein